jgi:hypothetical protein
MRALNNLYFINPVENKQPEQYRKLLCFVFVTYLVNEQCPGFIGRRDRICEWN